MDTLPFSNAFAFIDAGDLIGLVAVFIPIVAIVGGIWAGMISKTQKHLQEMARIRASQPDLSHSELNSFRQELAALRETTTQYDISVERNMHEVMQRLQSLEAKTAALPAQPASQRPIDYRAPQTQPEDASQRLQLGG